VIDIYAQNKNNLPIEITVFKGEKVFENAFLIRSGKNLVLIDALSASNATEQISQAIKGKKLRTIFITHGHPDHFLGLSSLLKNNPEAQIFAGSEGVKQDIIRYVSYATSKGLMESEPAMKLKSAENQTGFDYEKIKIIKGNKLELGAGQALIIENIKDATECDHNTILYHEQSNLLFASDLLYNKVFSWLGPGVEQHNIENWIENLKNLQARYDKEGLTIFPGHGDPSDKILFDINIQYLNSFQNILSRTKSKSDAIEFFKQLYPQYEGDFLLSRSIDHWIDSTASKTSIAIKNIQDLTHTLTSDFPFIPVPGVTFPFEATPIATMEDHGVRANKWTIHEHIGTQVDAPNHFAPKGISLEALKVEDLIVPVIVIDISKKSLANADAELTMEDIKQWEAVNGRIPDKACVMMYSGWEAFLYEDKYLGVDKAHIKHFPGISLAALQFLISERNISGVGVDVISLDPGYDNEYKGHKVILGAGKWAVEAVANLKLIPAKGAYLFVGAPKIKGATGGIVRLLAVW
jgi:kynurenine formamidase/glyoxylase-like metal-dependent hydrolase (beta-lactamase superfamily II)